MSADAPQPTQPTTLDIQAIIKASVDQAVAKALSNAQEHGKDVDDSHKTTWQRNEDRREAERERFNTQREVKKEEARRKRQTVPEPEKTRERVPTRHPEGRTVESKMGGWPFGIPQQPPSSDESNLTVGNTFILEIKTWVIASYDSAVPKSPEEITKIWYLNGIAYNDEPANWPGDDVIIRASWITPRMT